MLNRFSLINMLIMIFITTFLTTSLKAESAYDFTIKLIDLRKKHILDELELLAKLDIPEIDLESLLKNSDLVSIFENRDNLLNFVSENKGNNLFNNDIQNELNQLKFFLENKIEFSEDKIQFNIDDEAFSALDLLYKISKNSFKTHHLKNLIYAIRKKENLNKEFKLMKKVVEHIETLLLIETKSNKIKKSFQTLEQQAFQLNGNYSFSKIDEMLKNQYQSLFNEITKPLNINMSDFFKFDKKDLRKFIKKRDRYIKILEAEITKIEFEINNTNVNGFSENKVNQDKSNQDKSNQDKSDQDKSDQDKSDQDKSDQDKSDQDKSDQDKVNQDKVNQDKSDQDKSNQDKIDLKNRLDRLSHLIELRDFLKNTTFTDQFFKNLYKIEDNLETLSSSKSLQIKTKRGDFDSFTEKLTPVIPELYKLSNEIAPVFKALEIIYYIQNKGDNKELEQLFSKFIETNRVQSVGKSPDSLASFNDLELKNISIQKSNTSDLTELVMSTFTNFIVKRSRQELYTAFFRKLYQSKRVAPLFPLSFEQLEHYQDEKLYSVSTTWLAAVENDLQNLPQTISENSILGDDGVLLKISLDFIEKLKKGNHPKDILDYYLLKNRESSDINRILMLLNILSQELVNSPQGRWISVEEFNVLQKNDVEILLWFIFMKNKDSIENIISKNELLDYVRMLTPVFDIIEKQRAELRKENIKDKAGRFQIYQEEFFNLIKIVSEKFNSNIKITSFLNRDIPIILEIARAISEKSYGREILNILKFLQNLINRESNRIQKDKIFSLKGDILKFGSILADILISKNEEQLESVLERFVLPSSNSVNFTIYMGLGGGYQYNQNSEIGKKFAGFTIPVGFEYKKPISEEFSASFYAYFIDLIPIMIYKEVFAPGFSFVLNYHPIPISIGGAYEYFPKLDSEKDIHRFFLFIAYRMTLFEFF
ncbi:hypothetical protein JXR93_09115 [bacterium]|nr:hypothetical protein [bacterium]